MVVHIGRTSGPCTDQEVESDFGPHEIDVIKDVLAMVNKATSNKEGWYLYVDDGPTIIPSTK